MKMTYKGWVLGPGSTVSVKLDCKVTAKSPGPAPTPPARLTARQSRIGGDSLPDPHPEVYCIQILPRRASFDSRRLW